MVTSNKRLPGFYHTEAIENMHSPRADESWHSTRSIFSIAALNSARRALILCIFITLIASIALTSVRGYAQPWLSKPTASRSGYLPWSGQPLTGPDVLRRSAEEVARDQVWISPRTEDLAAFMSSSGEALQEVQRAAGSQPSLEKFRRSVMNGHTDQLTGIWVEDVLAFRVQQGLTSYAPAAKDTLSFYNWAWMNGVVGLLIHNYLGGTQLYKLNPGVRIAAIYGNGGVDWYLSRGGTWYESRTSPSGGFAGPFRIWSCEDCAFDVSSRDLHNRHYAGNHHLAFQTCVYAEGRVGLVIIEAYLDWQPEPQLTDGDPMGISERYDPGLPKLYRGVVE